MADGEKCNNKDCKTIITDLRKNGQYKKYCCSSCRRLGVAEKVKQTSLEKYGVSNPSKSKVIKDRIKETFTEKYGPGVTNAMHIQEFKDKIVETNIEKYGTDKPQLLEESKQKTINSNIKKYGIKQPQQLQDFKDRSARTCEEKYGVSAPQQNKIIRKKSIDTCLEKYGAENIAQLPSTWDKIRETSVNRYGVTSPNQDPIIHRKQDGARYRNKEYIFPSGKVVLIQGYENLAIATLLFEGYAEDSILTETKDMPDIRYVQNGSIHRYFPDIYLPNHNLIIEVKSTYTFGISNEKNLLKKQACLDAGYNFRFMIFNGRKNLQDISE